MATYNLTASATLDGVGTPYIAHVAISAGQFVYIDPADNRARLAVNTTELASRVHGIALNNAAADQPVNILRSGDVTISTGPPVAGILVLSGTAGRMMDVGDLTAGHYVTVVGYMKTAATLHLVPMVTNLQVPAG